MTSRIWLVMKTTSGRDRPFPIRKDRTVIGREIASDVRIPMPAVAPKHCEIVIRETGLRLTDLGSDLGTLHNGRRIDQAELKHSDQVTIGPVTFHVRFEAKPLHADNGSVDATIADIVDDDPV